MCPVRCKSNWLCQFSHDQFPNLDPYPVLYIYCSTRMVAFPPWFDAPVSCCPYFWKIQVFIFFPHLSDQHSSKNPEGSSPHSFAFTFLSCVRIMFRCSWGASPSPVTYWFPIHNDNKIVKKLWAMPSCHDTTDRGLSQLESTWDWVLGMQQDSVLSAQRVALPVCLDDCIVLTRLFFVVLLGPGQGTGTQGKTNSSEEL